MIRQLQRRSHILAQVAPPRRRGLIFSIKQSAVPAGGLLAGVLLPPLAEAAGWPVAILCALALVLPEETALRATRALRQPQFALMGLLLAWMVIGRLFRPIHLLAINLLYPEVSYG